jgi:photosystem II stability/assembly factor-like uncharacterized protein
VGWLVGAGGTFLHTSDGGATWLASVVVAASSSTGATSAPSAQFAPATTAPAPRVNAVSFIDERRGWAVGSGGSVFSTTNGGRSWSARASETDADLLDVKFFDEREGFAVGAGGAVLHTTDGGVTWALQPADTTHQLERLHFLDRRRGWAVGFGGTILTYDGATRPRPLLREDPRLR